MNALPLVTRHWKATATVDLSEKFLLFHELITDLPFDLGLTCSRSTAHNVVKMIGRTLKDRAVIEIFQWPRIMQHQLTGHDSAHIGCQIGMFKLSLFRLKFHLQVALK